jgi:alpha-D-xyloside xylohydrolase
MKKRGAPMLGRTFSKRVFPVLGLMSLHLLTTPRPARAQETEAAGSLYQPRRIISFEHANQEVTLKCDVGMLVIKAYADNIVHLRYFPGPEKKKLQVWGISDPPPAPKYRVDATLNAIRLSTAQLTVSVERKTAQVTFLDQKQNAFLASKQIQLKSARVAGEDVLSLHAEFLAPEDESYYGLGQHPNGWMDLRGQTVRLWHAYQPTEGEVIAIPFLVTNRKYGLIFDNPSKLTVVPGKDGVTSWDAEVAEAFSCFIIYGGVTDEIYKGYRLLTGATPLPPKTALGYIMGGQRPVSQEELVQLVRKYRASSYPADMLMLNTAESVLDPKRFSDPVSMNKEFRKLGVELVVRCPPRIGTESPHFETLDSMGCVLRDKDGKPSQDAEDSLIDLSKPSCASWFWNNIQKDYGTKGFGNWWLDGNEPDVPPYAIRSSAGMGAGIFNLYPLLQAKAVYEGHRKDLGSRPLILSRSGYLGIQQYGAVVGSSQAAPQWDALKRQVAAGLNLAASGLPYWFSAIGSGQPAAAARIDPASSNFAELYIRWFEFAAFCPTFLIQGLMPAQELWAFGPAAEKTLAKYLSLRYRLMPYIYSLAHAVTETGAPFTRALFMDFPLDPEARDIKDEYMFGPAFLVAPVVEKEGTGREVYLPKGTAWYDYWTGRKYPGGQRLTVQAPVEILPLFARAGSIIPHGKDVASTHEEQRSVELWVYPGADAQFDLYQDDGRTYEYLQNKFSLAQIRWNDAAQKITITGDDRKLFALPQDKWLRLIK